MGRGLWLTLAWVCGLAALLFLAVVVSGIVDGSLDGVSAAVGVVIFTAPCAGLAVLFGRLAARARRRAEERAAASAAEPIPYPYTPPAPAAATAANPTSATTAQSATSDTSAPTAQKAPPRGSAAQPSPAASGRATSAPKRERRVVPEWAETARERAERLREEREARGYQDKGTWYPPKPHGEPMDPWGRGEPVEVVGEAYHDDAFRRLVGRKPGFGTQGATLRTSALLVPDPGNPYGKGKAVAVYLEGEHVGYLAQDDANRYFRSLATLQRRGQLLRVPCDVWARDGWNGRVAARATLRLPAPGRFEPANALPDAPHVVLPEGRAIQVTKEDEHMDVLTPYVLPEAGAENPIAVTLRSINEIRARSSYEAVQVEIDGQRAGVLTKGQSEKLLPLVKHVERRGLVPVAHAIVRGSTLKADVVIRCATAETISEGWLASLGPETAPANVDATPEPPARPEFEWDDEDVSAGAMKPDRERDDLGEESQVGPEEE